MENKIVLVRGDRSGVHYGTLKSRKGKEAVLTNAKRIRYWDGACGLDQLSVDGVTNKKDTQISVAVAEILILDVIEIYPMTEKALANLEEIKVWKK